MINTDKRREELKEKKDSGQELGRLFNIDIGLEDNISTKGIKTEVGSKMLEGYIPPFNASIVERILEQDAIIKTKIATREFGVGEKIDSKMGELVRAGDIKASIGLDVGGEVRNLAAASNLYGLKPTYGSISRYGLIGSGPSLEQVGIISEDIEVLKLIFESISGKDEKDSTSLVVEEIEDVHLKDLKIAIIKEYMDDLDGEARESLEKEIEKFKDLGGELEYISIASLKYAPAVYNILQSAEFSSDMGKFDGLLYGFNVEEYEDNEDFFIQNRTRGFSEEVKKKIMFGNFVLSEENYKDFYEKSQRIRSLIAEEVREEFKKYHIILSPIEGEDIKYTLLANLVGCPALSLPRREDKDLSLQVMGDKFSEKLLFKIAKEYEEKVLKNKDKEEK